MYQFTPHNNNSNNNNNRNGNGNGNKNRKQDLMEQKKIELQQYIDNLC